MSWDRNFYTKFFTTLNSKNKIASLQIVTIEKPELTSLLILYIHGKQSEISKMSNKRVGLLLTNNVCIESSVHNSHCTKNEDFH